MSHLTYPNIVLVVLSKETSSWVLNSNLPTVNRRERLIKKVSTCLSIQRDLRHYKLCSSSFEFLDLSWSEYRKASSMCHVSNLLTRNSLSEPLFGEITCRDRVKCQSDLLRGALQEMFLRFSDCISGN